MNYGKVNYTKVSCKTDIKQKQAMFNRFKRRYHASNNPTEKRFLKNEAAKVCTQLKQWSKRWNNWGFGACTWITKSFNTTCFTSSKTCSTYKTTARKSPTGKTYGRKCATGYSTRRTSGGRKSGTTNRTRSSAARSSYSAW